ncbi:sugar phosphate isomerase/epimerase family protein [Planctomycetota bacterium]
MKTGTAMSFAATGSLLLPNLARADLASTNTPVDNTGKMKWCMYTYSLFGGRFSINELDIVDMCRKTKALGIDGLDIIGAGYNKSWQEIRKITDDHGIDVVCYTKGVKELESTDEAIIRKGIDEFKKRLKVAHILGSNRIMMNMGGSTPDRHANRKNLIKSLEKVLPIATAESIEVTIEHHNNPKAPFRISADFDEALAVVPGLRIAYDSGNIYVAGEDSVQGYKNNQEQITHMHFKDFSANGRLCIPGQGIIDFPNLIKAMKEANYTGYINLETPMKQPDGYECYEKSMEILSPLIA